MEQEYLICLVSLGCPKNLVDTEVMCGSLVTDGFYLTGDPEQADVMLINTCGFLKDARDEAAEEIRQAIEWKKSRENRVVVVTGCMPQRDPEETKFLFPEVDLFMGLDDVPQAAELLRERLEAGRRAPIHKINTELPTYIPELDAPRLQLTPQSYAYVKIAEGCNHRCTFCAIPGIRGNQRSRSIESIVAECRQYIENGVRELNFISQDTTRYGEDLRDGTDLSALIKACDQLAGDFWIRLLYVHPKYLSDEVMQAVATSTHVVPYIDIPLQHISDSVLKSMGRRFNETDTRERMQRLRELCPDVTVRTTFIVGFPGETDDDFEKLYQFVADYQFERLGVFIYSPEEGTPAKKIKEGLVPHDLARNRHDRLMELQAGIAQQKNEALEGSVLPVVVEYQDETGLFVGRTAADAPDVDNLIQFKADFDAVEAGLVDVQVNSCSAYDLFGTAVSE